MAPKLQTRLRVGIAFAVIAAVIVLLALACCRGRVPELSKAELLKENLGTPISLSEIDSSPSLSALTDGLDDVLLDDLNASEQLRFKCARYGDNYKFSAYRTPESVYYSVLAFEPAAIDPARAPVTKRGISLGANSLAVVDAYGDATEVMRTDRLEIFFYVRDSVELRFTFLRGALTCITMDSYRGAKRGEAGEAGAAE